jgi:hypothetical protein
VAGSVGIGRAPTEKGGAMTLSKTELRYYDSNVLRLPADKRKGYHEQVDRLIAELCGVWKIKKIKDYVKD